MLLLPRQMIIFGGETLPASYIEEIQEQNKNLKVINHYGPTETTIGKLLMHVNVSATYDTLPIGKPFSETSVYIVNKEMQQCPVGIPGELLIGGKGVSKGYLNNPNLTAQYFIQNPFTNQPQKVYKTGDIVKMSLDGDIQFIGRKDNQIKIRGHRIELGEIETRIQLSGLVENAVVLLKNTDKGRKYIVSYVLPKAAFTTNAMYEYLNVHLPEYMHPSSIITLSEFPLTANGKIDRNKIAEIAYMLLDREELLLPRTAIETKLWTLWKKILEVQEISVDDNFFRIGGDSLLIVKMKHEIETAFNQSINIVDLFNYKTIEEQALLFGNSETKEEVQEIDEIKF
jgi:acyl-coenzyme A synthetase/AMP-(fatty) acid ligase/acyl carrier protein